MKTAYFPWCCCFCVTIRKSGANLYEFGITETGELRITAVKTARIDWTTRRRPPFFTKPRDRCVCRLSSFFTYLLFLWPPVMDTVLPLTRATRWLVYKYPSDDLHKEMFGDWVSAIRRNITVRWSKRVHMMMTQLSRLGRSIVGSNLDQLNSRKQFELQLHARKYFGQVHTRR